MPRRISLSLRRILPRAMIARSIFTLITRYAMPAIDAAAISFAFRHFIIIFHYAMLILIQIFMLPYASAVICGAFSRGADTPRRALPSADMAFVSADA